MNHYGACVSYTTAWKYLKQLTQEARYLDAVREGHWQWVYDNLNYLSSIRHEREGSYIHSVCKEVLIIVLERSSCMHVCVGRAHGQST